MKTVRPSFAALALLSLLVSACGTSSATTVPPTPTAGSPSGLQAQVASSDLAVGRNRFTFGLITANHPLSGGTPRVTFYYLRRATIARMGTVTAHFNYFARGLKDTDANSQAVELKGVYVAYPTFSGAGKWGAEIRLRYHGRPQVVRAGFSVRTHSLTPAVGAAALRTHNPTIAQEPATKLDSGRPPDDMHRLSVAQALAQHKPLVLLFATPGFCESRMCGPVTQIVEGLESRYRSAVNFIHIEIYKNANPADGYAPAVLQWHLQSEPWVFVIDRRGIIRAKFDGPTSGSEIQSAIRATLKA